jgi:3-phenylpropionate/cinnamic acid dioxygenase small subunit
MSDELPAAIAVLNQVYRYAELIDAGDFDGVGDLFAVGSVTSEGAVAQEHHGREAVTAMYADWTRRYEDGTPHTKHVLTNPIVTVSADTAVVRSYFTVFQQTDEIALQPIIAGRYRDDFALVDGAWRFVNKHIITDLVGDLSKHLLQTF